MAFTLSPNVCASTYAPTQPQLRMHGRLEKWRKSFDILRGHILKEEKKVWASCIENTKNHWELCQNMGYEYELFPY